MKSSVDGFHTEWRERRKESENCKRTVEIGQSEQYRENRLEDSENLRGLWDD